MLGYPREMLPRCRVLGRCGFTPCLRRPCTVMRCFGCAAHHRMPPFIERAPAVATRPEAHTPVSQVCRSSRRNPPGEKRELRSRYLSFATSANEPHSPGKSTGRVIFHNGQQLFNLGFRLSRLRSRRRKGRPASSRRITCTADHLPHRAAGMPRSSRPAAMARNDTQPAACSSLTTGARSAARVFSCGFQSVGSRSLSE
jgi:hypothetical protein